MTVADLTHPPGLDRDVLTELLQDGAGRLGREDPELYSALRAEHDRQLRSLVMVASSSVVDPTVLACQASTAVNVTAEGYPGNRYHAGCAQVDLIEQLAIDRARAAFGATYANVQPHSASVANHTVLGRLLRPGDTVLGMRLHEGGHLTHGAPAGFSGQYFRPVGYGLDADGLIDYAEVRRVARAERPQLIICGATAYSRTVDFARFRRIADEVGALLLADISHIAGLVVTGRHANPVDHAHVTTACTHKQLYGPRGGLILLGRDHDMVGPDGRTTLRDLMQRAVFPFFQGAPAVNAIAAKARALALARTPEFAATTERIVADARALADALGRRGYRVVSGGTDNHIVLVDLGGHGLSGLNAERALESAQIVVNKNHVPGDTRPATVTSGLRLGTNTLALRGAVPADMEICAELTDRVLRATREIDDRRHELDPATRDAVRDEVERLCRSWPIPRYPTD
ncbi:serine hydroxymethyltransferase [Jidongwangia harbinensis]|uniref:serine hydroxymethyltransferase n=1 Tax=Jidongwangia harbinensis TaxID=2878561 RepID=UPI001CD95A8C|nr:serine hydroxymethyltransferase [Jidongwangia harbinensis]MCA2218365.1 serine hydroxymethyltransferase [Jidongwangia harbinensis]